MDAYFFTKTKQMRLTKILNRLCKILTGHCWVQFGKPIATFQAIQFKLADMATELDAAELMLLRAAWLEDNGIDFEKEAAMAKYYASDVAMRAAIEGVQIFGGYGYIKEYPAERHMRDAKFCQIYDGTNAILRIVVARKLIGLR